MMGQGEVLPCPTKLLCRLHRKRWCVRKVRAYNVMSELGLQLGVARPPKLLLFSFPLFLNPEAISPIKWLEGLPSLSWQTRNNKRAPISSSCSPFKSSFRVCWPILLFTPTHIIRKSLERGFSSSFYCRSPCWCPLLCNHPVSGEAASLIVQNPDGTGVAEHCHVQSNLATIGSTIRQ